MQTETNKYGVFRQRGLGRRKTYLARRVDSQTWSVVERTTSGKLVKPSTHDADCMMSQIFVPDIQFNRHYVPVDETAKTMMSDLTYPPSQTTIRA